VSANDDARLQSAGCWRHAARRAVTPDGGFGREGLPRTIARSELISLVPRTDVVRRELGLPDARVRTTDPKLWFLAR
jgi:hypothetical protein